MLNRISISFIAVFAFSAITSVAQSKKELRLKVSILESQVAQFRAKNKELARDIVEIKERHEEKKESEKVEVQDICDSLVLRNENLEGQIKILQNALFNKRLSNARDSLNPVLQKKHYSERNPQKRKSLMNEYRRSYLTGCFRLKTSHRLFAEQVVVEYELNPVTMAFEGYVRHQYVPDMGADEYDFQEMSGYYEQGEKGAIKLKITSLDDKAVDIVINHNIKKDIYNSLNGSEDDLKLIKTKVVAIEEFYFAKCK